MRLQDEPQSNEQFDLISRYETGKHYLTLRHDPVRLSYFITGNHMSVSMPKGTTRDDALARFARETRQSAKQLFHVAGEQVPDLYDAVPGTRMATAEMKRRITKGSRWIFARPSTGDSRVITIDIVQQQDFRDTEQRWISFPRADRLRDLGNGAFAVLEPEDASVRYTMTPAGDA